jgi:hypothetical protein
MILRLLGPLVVVSTLGLLASGVVLVLLGPDGSRASLVELPGFRVDWITIHQGAFLVWAAATGLHVLGRFVPALNLTLAAPPRDAVPGVRGRGLALLLTGIAAVAAGAVALALAGSWHGDQGGDSEGARPPAAVTAAAAVR